MNVQYIQYINIYMYVLQHNVLYLCKLILKYFLWRPDIGEESMQ